MPLDTYSSTAVQFVTSPLQLIPNFSCSASKTHAVLLCGTPKQKITHESQQQKKLQTKLIAFLKLVLKLPYWRSSVHECLLIDVFPFLLTLNIEHGLAAGLISATALLIWTMLAVILTDIYCWSEESHSKEQALVNSRKRVDMIPKALPCFSDLGEKPLIYSMELPYVCSCKGAPWSSAVQPMTQCLFVCLWRGLAAVLPLKINPVFLKLDSEPWNKSCRVNSPCC